MSIPYYHDRICLNVLAKDHQNAIEVYEAAEHHVLVGVLSSSYDNTREAAADMKRYMEELDGNVSIGLGGGNPAQCQAVADIAQQVPANHVNQIFSAVGMTRAKMNQTSSHINALVSPSGILGMVNIATGPQSCTCEPALVPVETAIALIMEMGGNAIKFFPMKGLACKEELIAVAKACALHDMILEPTGGIDLANFKEIMELILQAGVRQVIPHVYSSIIDQQTKETRVEDVRTLLAICKELV